MHYKLYVQYNTQNRPNEHNVYDLIIAAVNLLRKRVRRRGKAEPLGGNLWFF